MAVSSARRKRTIAIVFAFCLVTALFLYKRGVQETWYGTKSREAMEGDISRLDQSNRPTVGITTASVPTQIYSVVEFQDESEDLADVGTIKVQEKEIEQDRINEEQKNNDRRVEHRRGEEQLNIEKLREMTQNILHLESSEDVDDKRKQSNTYKVMSNSLKKRAKAMGSLSPSQSVQSGLTTKSSRAKTTTKENMFRIISKVEQTSYSSYHRTTTTTKKLPPPETTTTTTTKKRPPPKTTTTTTNKLPPPEPTSPTEEPLTCKIPPLDPFHPHVSQLQHDVGTDLRKICLSMHPYTPVFKIVDNKLVLKEGVEEARIKKSSVELRDIKRDSDSDFNYKKARNPFKNLPSLQESKDIGNYDFFRLDYRIDGRQASDLYARASPRLDVLKRQAELARKFQNEGLPLNVLIIGFDSISRANFVRKLPRVKSFLETGLNTYFMKGMSIVGDATTPILIAMLTGKDETVLPEGRTSYEGKPIDNWPWIMKDYEKQGYMTLFAEDDPSVSAFNLRLRGFSQSPTHHYMRPFWLSLESEHERDEPGRCSKSESMVNHTLKYVKSFYDAYPTSRKFVFAFHSYLAHAHPNHLSLAEEDLMWFLRTFVDKGYLKDTMLIIMGDHGSRNGEYRDTMQGKLEERLPWFSISLPSEFHRRFSDLATNLRNNQALITSSFDVHATLRHILTYPKLPSGEQTQSLFEKLSRKRGCHDAGIAEHWCPCFKLIPTDVNSKRAQNIAVSAVKLINEKLSRVPVLASQCHRLSLDSVIHAVILSPNNKVQTFYSTDQDGDRSVNFAERTKDLIRYQIIFTTQPNNAKFEVTASVSYPGDHVTVNPEISRVNRYNNQPACIAKQYPYARKFCYCRTSL